MLLQLNYILYLIGYMYMAMASCLHNKKRLNSDFEIL